MRTLVGILVSLFLLSACEGDASRSDPGGGDAGADAASEGATPSPMASIEDPEAARLFRQVLDTLAPGGGWDRTRYLEFDWIVARESGPERRSHRWDRETGRYRVEAPLGDADTMVALFDVDEPTEGEGVWVNGAGVTDPARSDSLASRAHAIFINDSYWLLMPFKWGDPGVRAVHAGTEELWGKTYEVVELTFEGSTGLTPQNRYRAFVDPASGVMEAWQFFRNRADTEPGFTLAWTEWRRYGPILLSSRRETEDGSSRIWFENLKADTEVPPDAFSPPGGS